MATLLVSCEHATAALPEEHRHLFRGAEGVLGSHRGWDPGALDLARTLAERGRARLLQGEVSRLLIDLNRTPGNPGRFSEFVAGLGDDGRNELHARYFVPYLKRLRDGIAAGVAASPPVLHLSVHSFVRDYEGVRRSTDIGILFDPGRRAEADFAGRWLAALKAEAPGLRCDANAPYRGTDDGLTTLLRREFPDSDYLGIELELCQSFFLDGKPWSWRRLKGLVPATVPHT